MLRCQPPMDSSTFNFDGSPAARSAACTCTRWLLGTTKSARLASPRSWFFIRLPSRLRRYVADLPFAVVADPNRKLYDEFGVHNSIRGMLNRNVARAVGRGIRQTRSARSLAGGLGPTENHLGMPADFLIAPDGAVVARKYGEHADDQWSVDELLRLATA